MDIWDELEWDERNENHIIDEHGVLPDEVEEAVRDPNAAPFPAHSGRVGYIGETEHGRFLVIILERKARGLLRPITAYDAKRKEKSLYRRYNR